MHASDDIGLFRARILTARNASELSRHATDALRCADDIRVGSLEVHRGKFPIALRHYAIVRFLEEEQEQEQEYTDVDGERKVRRYITYEPVDHVVDVWEVQGILPEVAELSGSWIYEEATAAASCLAYLLMKMLDATPAFGDDRVTDLPLLLTAVMSSQAIGLRVTKVVPSAPRDGLDKQQADRNALVVRAIEARKSGASATLRKEIAVDLYHSGDTNVRRISMLTGLARDTVYKALRGAHIKR
ncbi:hypothetical protein [Nonomuraea sp. NPDC049158]|uniref:hypothetical protein n=1 Tax=Nonomuraea sp. NPDC049158 TaxID=3155649 RepID=UPI00340DE6CB